MDVLSRSWIAHVLCHLVSTLLALSFRQRAVIAMSSACVTLAGIHGSVFFSATFVEYHSRNLYGHQEPVLFSAGWESRHNSLGSTIARHEWKGLSKVPGALEDWVTKQKVERQERQKQYERAQRRIPGMWEEEDDN